MIEILGLETLTYSFENWRFRLVFHDSELYVCGNDVFNYFGLSHRYMIHNFINNDMRPMESGMKLVLIPRHDRDDIELVLLNVKGLWNVLNLWNNRRYHDLEMWMDANILPLMNRLVVA